MEICGRGDDADITSAPDPSCRPRNGLMIESYIRGCGEVGRGMAGYFESLGRDNR